MTRAQDKKDVLERVGRLWSNGEFTIAHDCIKAAYQMLPEDSDIAYEYGHILGELSEGPPSDDKLALRSEAIRVLAKLCDDMRDIPISEHWKIRRHFYIYSGQHLKNRELGYEEISKGNPLGTLSIGFGCLHHAIELIRQEKISEAQSFALEGEQAFRKLLSDDTPRYGRYLAHALTLAILGRKQEALEATERAAFLSGKAGSELESHFLEIEKFSSLANI
ncbi:MAG: hypothetical protein EOP04_32185 [Proteobacteria bacterium]|nr:MAG: hypothetical protein EOP04_32185 [Pseudomonadota bacterium]